MKARWKMLSSNADESYLWVTILSTLYLAAYINSVSLMRVFINYNPEEYDQFLT